MHNVKRKLFAGENELQSLVVRYFRKFVAKLVSKTRKKSRTTIFQIPRVHTLQASS